MNPRLVDLLGRIFVGDKNRIKIKDIMEHPWMTMNLEDQKLKISFEKINKFAKLSKVDRLLFSLKS